MKNLILLLIVVLFVVGSCKDDNKFDIDVSDINIDIKFNRFDNDLFELDIDSIYNEVPNLAHKYGEFFDMFTHRIINIGGIENKAFPDHLKLFIEDRINKEAYDYSQNIFSDFSKQEEEIIEAFKHYNFYFPEKPIPDIYLYVSGFNQSVVTAENIIGIGIDKYMGSNCDYYHLLRLPQYMRYKMRQEMIVVDCMKAWAQSEYEFDELESNLMENMLYKAKIQYFINAMLPNKADTLKWGFPNAKLEWCRNNEQHIWYYLIDNKLLFSSDYMEIKRFTNDGPFTTSFTNESPARASVWLGMQVIEGYLKNNPEVSFQDLMNETDYQKILNNSRYEP